jgi:hypothetical protein
LKTLLNISLCLFLLGSFAAAENLTGVVTNATTNKPSAGDDVILIKLAQGMEEAARVKSDAKGKFSLALDSADAPHLVRVVHQGVTYHRMAPPGSTSVEVQVYDVTNKVQGVTVTADVLRFQAQGNELQGVRLFAVNNKSNPPRTQMNDKSFEFYLPEGASVDSGEAQTAGGQPLNLAPVPQDEKNRYAFTFPLRPGETTFQVTFHMQYPGELSVDPKLLYPAQHFVVMLPKTIQFAGAQGAAYKNMQNPKDPNANVEVASNTQVGDPLGFKISGTGILTDPEGGGDAEAGPGTQGRDARPGGGLGPPIEAPRPLQKYTPWILAGFGIALTAGALMTARRPAMAGGPTASKSGAAASSGSPLLDALKEELFQLEMEHKQGSISQEEYAKARTALDQTLERALKRKPVA